MPAAPKPPQSLPASDDVRGVLAYNMRLLRVQRGWSQERLALECELDRTYVSAVERSRWNVSLANIERFAQALQTPAWKLLLPPADAAQGCALEGWPVHVQKTPPPPAPQADAAIKNAPTRP